MRAPSRAEQSRRSRRSRPAPAGSRPATQLVVALHRRIDAERGRGDRAMPPTGHVELAAEHRAHRGHAGIARGSARRALSAARIVASVSNGSVPLGARRSWNPLRQQQLAERLAHAGREHHHVEQHRRRDGDAEHGEQRCGAMPAERREARAWRSSHQRPNSASGGVRTSRRAASQPAPIPSTSDSATARRDDVGRDDRERERRAVHRLVVAVDERTTRRTPTPTPSDAAEHGDERRLEHDAADDRARARCPSDAARRRRAGARPP